MTTDQLPQVRTGDFEFGAGKAEGKNKPRVLMVRYTPIGTKVEVQRWKNDDGTEGNSQLRLSRKYWHKGAREERWENITLKAEDLFYLAKLTEEMANQGLLPIGEEFRFE